jgi:hypothetical protein
MMHVLSAPEWAAWYSQGREPLGQSVLMFPSPVRGDMVPSNHDERRRPCRGWDK